MDVWTGVVEQVRRRRCGVACGRYMWRDMEGRHILRYLGKHVEEKCGRGKNRMYVEEAVENDVVAGQCLA